MNKALIIIFFFSLFSFSQKREFDKNSTKHIKEIFCNKPFSTDFDTNESFKFQIIHNKDQFYFNHISGDEKNEIKSNGEIIININHKNEEIEIYSLTEKEKKKCFFISKFLDEFKIIETSNNETIGLLNKINLLVKLKIINKSKKNKQLDVFYSLHNSNNGNNEPDFFNKIVFYNENEFNEKFNSFFSNNIFNLKKIKEKYLNWEIIDFR